MKPGTSDLCAHGVTRLVHARDSSSGPRTATPCPFPNVLSCRILGLASLPAHRAGDQVVVLARSPRNGRNGGVRSYSAALDQGRSRSRQRGYISPHSPNASTSARWAHTTLARRVLGNKPGVPVVIPRHLPQPVASRLLICSCPFSPPPSSLPAYNIAAEQSRHRRYYAYSLSQQPGKRLPRVAYAPDDSDLLAPRFSRLPRSVTHFSSRAQNRRVANRKTRARRHRNHHTTST